MKINLEDNELQFDEFEMQNTKLSSTLIGNKHVRERARSELGEGESKWKWRVNRLYEGVDELYTPSTQEMDQRAEIHKLFDLLKDCKTRTEKLESILDMIYTEMRDIENENIRITKEELALRLNSTDGSIMQIQKGIEKTRKENEDKNVYIKDLQQTYSDLSKRFKILLKTKEKYLKQLELLKQKIAERKADEEERKIEHQASLKRGQRQKEIDEEIRKN